MNVIPYTMSIKHHCEVINNNVCFYEEKRSILAIPIHTTNHKTQGTSCPLCLISSCPSTARFGRMSCACDRRICPQIWTYSHWSWYWLYIKLIIWKHMRNDRHGDIACFHNVWAFINPSTFSSWNNRLLRGILSDKEMIHISINFLPNN